MSEELYVKLREFLDKMPGGYPQTETGVEMKLLKKLFTPEQAGILLQMTPMPEPASAIAKRIGMDEAEAAEKIEVMAQNGLILRVRIGEDPYYMAVSFAVGIFEFQINTIDREFSELFDEYIPYMAKDWARLKTQQLRILPVESSVGSLPAVQTYDRVRELIKGKTLIGLAPCVCAKEKEAVGEPCTRPTERCIMFDMAAQYYIENKMAREITLEECLALLKMAEEQALVLTPSNAKETNNICMCCSCCCGHLRMLKLGGHPAEQVQSSFFARIDPELCNGCGTCEDRCQMDAIKENDGVCEVILERCIGCGLCVPTCPTEAILLKERVDVMPLPENMVDMQIKIAVERGQTG